jgi:hypothetical protein
MYGLEKVGKVFTSKFVGTGPSSYEKRIYRAVVSQRLRNPKPDGRLFFLRTISTVTGFVTLSHHT